MQLHSLAGNILTCAKAHVKVFIPLVTVAFKKKLNRSWRLVSERLWTKLAPLYDNILPIICHVVIKIEFPRVQVNIYRYICQNLSHFCRHCSQRQAGDVVFVD